MIILTALVRVVNKIIMATIEFLRQFRIGGYAIFDLVVAFLGIYLLSPLLSKIFLKFKIIIPKINWVFLTLPIGILTHLVIGNITPMTRNFVDINGHYILKILILILLFSGLRNIKIVKENKK
jgi:ethanolamine transporter EutH